MGFTTVRPKARRRGGRSLPGDFPGFHWAEVRDLLPAMNGADCIWDKLTRVVIFLLVLAVLVGIGICYYPLIQSNASLRKEIELLNEQVRKEKEINKQLSTAIESLRDPKTVERLLRGLGYAKPGETVIRFEEPVTNSTSPR